MGRVGGLGVVVGGGLVAGPLMGSFVGGSGVEVVIGGLTGGCGKGVLI